MKSLNENWFAFTLVAVVFGILGFLLGRTTGHPHMGPRGMFIGGHEEMIKLHKGGEWISEDVMELGDIEEELGNLDLGNINVEVIKTEDGNVTVTVDSVGTDAGERKVRIIKKRIEK